MITKTQISTWNKRRHRTMDSGRLTVTTYLRIRSKPMMPNITTTIMASIAGFL